MRLFQSISKTFQSGKAAGYDNIPMSIIKESIHLIAQPLAHIISLSITHCDRRDSLTVKLFNEISADKNHKLHSLLPERDSSDVNLRSAILIFRYAIQT